MSAREDWFMAGSPASLRARRAARAELARATAALLARDGLRVSAPPGAMTLHLSTPTGRTVVVSRLDEIADAARALSGHPPDPLDPARLDDGTASDRPVSGQP